MKKKYCSALVLGCSFFLLTGFDSKLTTEDIFKAMATSQANANHSSISVDESMTMTMEMSLSSQDSTVPPVSATILVNSDISSDLLKDSSMKIQATYDMLVPGQATSYSTSFYRVPNLKGDFKNYFYTDLDATWIKTTLPDMIESYLQQIISLSFSAPVMDVEPDFDSMLDSLAEWAESLDIRVSEEEYMQLEELFSMLEDFYQNLVSNVADLYTVSPDPVIVNGISCYELKGSISDDILGLSDFLEDLIDELYQAGLEENSYNDLYDIEQPYLDEILRCITASVAGFSENITYYINDSTFEYVQSVIDYSGWDLSAMTDLVSMIFELDGTFDDYGEDFSIPEITFSFPVYTLTIDYRYDQVQKLQLPVGAIGAEELPFEDVIDILIDFN